MINSLYRISKSEVNTSGFECEIVLNPDHEVYQAHFPGYPVTPGVVQLQIVEELIEQLQGLDLSLSKVSQCKFVHTVNPLENELIRVRVEMKDRSINQAQLGVRVTITSASGIHMEARVEYQVGVT